MVLGSTASASSWEPFRRAIQALLVVFADRPELVMKHRPLLDMLTWEDEVDPHHCITPAFPCTMNNGIIDEHGIKVPLPARIYVDDALTLATNCKHMEHTLAAPLLSRPYLLS
jgi:hypothetical protein